MFNKINIWFVFSVAMFAQWTECLKVSIYYEALCYDSTRFIALQLYPNYPKLRNYIDLEFIPYGKAIHNFRHNRWIFECQHGPNECKGNKYQSCALAQNNGQDKDVAFISCVMRERNPADVVKMENCAHRFNINWDEISHCAKTSRGDNLLAWNGNKTNDLNPNLSFVPTIIYDDEYDDYLQEWSLTDFAAVVCSKIEGEKPEVCDNRQLPRRKSILYYFV